MAATLVRISLSAVLSERENGHWGFWEVADYDRRVAGLLQVCQSQCEGHKRPSPAPRKGKGNNELKATAGFRFGQGQKFSKTDSTQRYRPNTQHVCRC